MARSSTSTDIEVVETPKYLSVSKVLVYIVYGWALFGVVMLGLRVFLLAFSANPTTRFVTFIYETSASYLSPFRAIFEGREVGATGYIDISAIFAIIIYMLFAWLMSALIRYVEFKIEQQRTEQEALMSKRANYNASVSKER